MNINNFLTLTIRAQDFNLVAERPVLLKKLRSLTLNRLSGMNYELDCLEQEAKLRKVNCKVLTARRDDKLVGWALLSREPSSFYFQNHDGYHPSYGALFEVFIHPEYRRQGIASELIKVARRKANPYKLCVAPWDTKSRLFYGKFKNFQSMEL